MTKKTTTIPAKPKMKNSSITIKKNRAEKKRMNQMSTYILDTDYDTNTNTIIKYYEKFDHKRIESLLKEALDNVEYSEKEGLDFFNDDEEAQFLSYIMFLIGVRFTSLSKDVPTALPEQIPIMLELVSTGLLSRIHEEVLDQEQVFIILDKLNQFTSLANNLIDLEESTRKELMGTVQNKEILNYMDPEVVHPLVDPYKKDSK